MKKAFTLIFLTFWLISCNGQTKLAGKTYVAEIGATCKDMTDGGCMIFTYRILEFKQDSVTISYRVKASCTPKERENGYEHMYDNLTKIYKWKINKDILIIENCKEFGKLKIQKSKLIGQDDDWMTAIEFIKQTK
jgi:hypothetical protein